MKTRSFTAILIGLSALPLTACGGSGPQKIDFTAAAKNATIATRECKKLIGDDGAKLNALGDGPATGTVVGHLADYAPDANYFTCKAGGPLLYVMRDSATMEDQLPEITQEATNDPLQRSWMTQSAQNEKNSMGVVVTWIAMSKKDDAPKQLQAWTKQLAK